MPYDPSSLWKGPSEFLGIGRIEPNQANTASFIFQQHSLGHIQQLGRPYMGPDAWRQIPPYMQYPTIAQPQPYGIVNLGSTINQSALGPLLNLAINQWLPQALGLSGGFGMPMFGSYNPFDIIRGQELYRQYTMASQWGLNRNVENLQRFLAIIPSIGSGAYFGGRPTDEAMKAMRLPAEALAYVGLPLVEPLLSQVGLSVDQFIPGGDAYSMHIRAWRAGRMAYQRNTGLFGMSPDQDKMMREELDRLTAPEGDWLAGLGFTRGLGMGQVGTVMQELAVRGLGPMESRAATGGRQMAFRYKELLKNWNETIATLQDVFGSTDARELFANLDRLTAGSAMQIGPQRAKMLAQNIRAVAYQTGISPGEIAQTVMITAARAQQMGMPGYVGANVGVEAYAAGRIFMGVHEPTVYSSTEHEARQTFIDIGLRGHASPTRRYVGALVDYYISGMRTGLSNEEIADLETLVNPKSKQEDLEAAYRRLRQNADAIIQRIARTEKGILQMARDPYSARFASMQGIDRVERLKWIEDSRRSLVSQIHKTIFSGDKDTTRAEALVANIEAAQPLPGETVTSMISRIGERYGAGGKLSELKLLFRRAGRAAGFQSEEDMYRLLQVPAGEKATADLVDIMGETEEIFEDAKALGKSGFIGRLHEAFQRMYSQHGGARASIGLRGFLARLVRFDPTQEQIDAISNEEVRKQFQMRNVLQAHEDLERINKKLSKPNLDAEERKELETARSEVEKIIARMPNMDKESIRKKIEETQNTEAGLFAAAIYEKRMAQAPMDKLLKKLASSFEGVPEESVGRTKTQIGGGGIIPVAIVAISREARDVFKGTAPPPDATSGK